MTKENSTVSKMGTTTLTGKWKSGTLKEGWYYYKTSDGHNDIATEYGLYCVEADNNVELEVLAPVPSYDQFVELTEKANQFSQLVKKVEDLEKRKNHFVELTNKYMDKYDDKFKKVDELVTKCHRLEKQLDIAVNTLEVIERMSDKFDNSLGFIEQLDCIKADCQETLYYLKEIDEVLK